MGDKRITRKKAEKTVRDNQSSSYGIGVSVGIALKGLGKRLPHNESLIVSCIEFDLSSIRVIESKLHVLIQDSTLQQPENDSPVSKTRESSTVFSSGSSFPV